MQERAQLAWDSRPQAAGDMRSGRGSHVVGQERRTGLNDLHPGMACAAHLLSLGGLESWCQAEGAHVTSPR